MPFTSINIYPLNIIELRTKLVAIRQILGYNKNESISLKMRYIGGGNMSETLIHRDLALDTLKKYKNDFEKQYGVTKIGIFGSVARGEAKPDSDVDIVVEMEKPDLFYMVHIKETLENEFQRPVDIVHYRNKMNNFLKERIQSEAIYA